MKVVDRFNVSKSPEGPRKFTFEFTGPGLISIVVVTILGIVWVFILGVLMGRGYKPETAVPQLGQIMPSASAPAQPEGGEQPTALKPEELHFMDSLQGKKSPEPAPAESTNRPVTSTENTTPVAPITTSVLEKSPAPLPKGKVAIAPAQPDKKTAAAERQREAAVLKENAAAKDKSSKEAAREKAKDSKEKAKETAKDKAKDDAAKEKTAKDKSAKEQVARDTAAAKEKAARDAKAAKEKASPKGEPRFRVTYQVAAFDDKKQAQIEADHLTKKGLNASPTETKVDGKTIFRVLVRAVGTEAEIKSSLEKAGTKSPILRYKKPL